MDPDLQKEYAMMGLLGRDSQFPDGMTIEVKVSCDAAHFERELGLFKWDGTEREFPAEGFDGIDAFIVNAYMGVSFKSIAIKAKLSSGEIVTLLREEQAKPKKAYRTKASIGDKEYSVILKTKE